MSDLRVHFIRHGDAQRSAEGGDANRSLSGRGRSITREVAKVLSESSGIIDQIYCSPLVRAVQTAEILAGHLDCDDSIEVQPVIAFPSSVTSVTALAETCPTNREGLAIVGHEPTLSAIVSHLLSSDTNHAHQGSQWRGFYPSQVVTFNFNRQLRAWSFQWQIMPTGPELIKSIS